VVALALQQGLDRQTILDAVETARGELKRRGATPATEEVQRFVEVQAAWKTGAVSDREWLDSVEGFFLCAFDADPGVRKANNEIRHFTRYPSYEAMYQAEAAVDEAYASVRQATMNTLVGALEACEKWTAPEGRGPYR